MPIMKNEIKMKTRSQGRCRKDGWPRKETKEMGRRKTRSFGKKTDMETSMWASV